MSHNTYKCCRKHDKLQLTGPSNLLFPSQRKSVLTSQFSCLVISKALEPDNGSSSGKWLFGERKYFLRVFLLARLLLTWHPKRAYCKNNLGSELPPMTVKMVTERNHI